MLRNQVKLSPLKVDKRILTTLDDKALRALLPFRSHYYLNGVLTSSASRS